MSPAVEEPDELDSDFCISEDDKDDSEYEIDQDEPTTKCVNSKTYKEPVKSKPSDQKKTVKCEPIKKVNKESLPKPSSQWEMVKCEPKKKVNKEILSKSSSQRETVKSEPEKKVNNKSKSKHRDQKKTVKSKPNKIIYQESLHLLLELSERRQSSRQSTSANSQRTMRRLKAREEKQKIKIEKRSIAPKEVTREPTQEERMREALITEKINLASLEKYQKLQLDKKEVRPPKRKIDGPFIRYHSFAVSSATSEDSNHKNSSGKIGNTSEKQNPSYTDNTWMDTPSTSKQAMSLLKTNTLEKEETSDVTFPTDKHEKTLIMFVNDVSNNEFNKAFPARPKPEKTVRLCAITNEPARYFDPVTNLPYNSIEASKIILANSQGTMQRLQAREKKEKIKIEKHAIALKKVKREPTQEERMREALITEKINLASLEKYQKLPLDKKEVHPPKRKIDGPFIRYHSFAVSSATSEDSNHKNSSGKIGNTSEKQNPSYTDNTWMDTPSTSKQATSLLKTYTLEKKETSDVTFPTDKHEKTLITFVNDVSNKEFNKAFPARPKPEKKVRLCAITNEPARYFDPVTNLPYNSIEAFKIIRQAYYQLLDQRGDESKPEVREWLNWYRNNKNMVTKMG